MMKTLPYFPFGQQFDLRMGTAAFRPDDRLIEVDNEYESEIAQKRLLLEKDHRYYFRASEHSEAAQWDVLELILNNLVQFRPDVFILEKKSEGWRWQNKKTREDIVFVFGKKETLPLEPLDWVGRQVQEDLVILSSDESATLIAGQLCFANGYSLDDKYGQPFLTIHAPAPKMIGPTMQAAQKLMERILVNRSVWRASWNFKISEELDLSSRHNKRYMEELKSEAPSLNAENIGRRLFIRIERQTLTRLAGSHCILFGIHTYQNLLENEVQDPLKALNMLQVLRTTPKEMLNYKTINFFEPALLEYLEKHSGNHQ